METACEPSIADRVAALENVNKTPAWFAGLFMWVVSTATALVAGAALAVGRFVFGPPPTAGATKACSATVAVTETRPPGAPAGALV